MFDLIFSSSRGDLFSSLGRQPGKLASANTLETHCGECAPCQVKKHEDMELKARVEKAFAENKQAISALFGKP